MSRRYSSGASFFNIFNPVFVKSDRWRGCSALAVLNSSSIGSTGSTPWALSRMGCNSSHVVSFSAVSNTSWLMSPAFRPVWSSFATSSLHSSTVFISCLRRSRTCVSERNERKPHPFLCRSKNAFISVGLFLGRSMDKSSS